MLALDVAGILDLDLHLIRRRRIFQRRAHPFDGHQGIVGHLRPTQQLFQALLAGQGGVHQGVDRLQ
ncbi:hypothetical protein D3C84_1054480 [compost metagenome]